MPSIHDWGDETWTLASDSSYGTYCGTRKYRRRLLKPRTWFNTRKRCLALYKREKRSNELKIAQDRNYWVFGDGKRYGTWGSISTTTLMNILAELRQGIDPHGQKFKIRRIKSELEKRKRNA